MKAYLGEDAESSIALATVGAAIAVSFIAAGGLLVLATKTKGGKSFTIAGFAAAASLTLVGAFGELWVVWKSATNFDLGGLENQLWMLFVPAMALLFIYGLRNILDAVAPSRGRHDHKLNRKSLDRELINGKPEPSQRRGAMI